VKRCRLRVAQEVRDLGNRERCIREVAFGGVPSRQIDQFLVGGAFVGELTLQRTYGGGKCPGDGVDTHLSTGNA
jgi:hypothetical protein